MPRPPRPEALSAWMELSQAASSARTAVNRSLQQRAGLSLAECLLLCQVGTAPAASLRMAEVADLLGIGKSAVTKTVDRLEGRGWIARRRDHGDRRTVYVGLTPAGVDVFGRAQPAFAEAVHRELAGALTDTEIRQLRRLLGKLLSA